jgi:hypothetical protein
MSKNIDHREELLNICKKQSRVKMKELCFLLGFDGAYLSDNLSITDHGMATIREAEEKNVLDKLKQTMINIGMTEIDVELNSSQLQNVGMNEIDVELKSSQLQNVGMNEIDVELKSSRLQNDKIQSFDPSLPSAYPSLPSPIDPNALHQFFIASKPESLRGICLCNLVMILKEQDIFSVSYFLSKLIYFLDIDYSQYLKLIDFLRQIKPTHN